eukprot:TRINITY_DN3990_c0_g3_i1.p1 TRINITY_DN3990_c0_g3~~TRINITY_DN3990_c0_g3_i1.p1  ORF type:complete len:110 (-),score=14.31 TRINITY_DN3990_c0_g3_i1:55-384(-)
MHEGSREDKTAWTNMSDNMSMSLVFTLALIVLGVFVARKMYKSYKREASKEADKIRNSKPKNEYAAYARATKGGIEDRSKSSNSDTLAAHSNNSKSDCAQRNSTKKPWK